tara:strand:+ start:5460 stop:6251 length:792 start_codon:yes stop_codon:yes gene_type:complete
MQNEEIVHYLTQDEVTLPVGAQVSLVDVPGASFSHSLHANVDFSDSSLRAMDARDAEFQGCSFSRVNLTGMLAEGAVFTDCTFTQLDMTQLYGLRATFTGCLFEGVDMASGYFEQATLRNNTFTSSVLSRAGSPSIFVGATIQDNFFSSCVLDSVDFESTATVANTMRACSLRGAYLTAASVYASIFESVDLRGASLDYAVIENTLISGDVHNVDATGIKAIGSDLAQAHGTILIDDDTSFENCDTGDHLVLAPLSLSTKGDE